MASTQLLEPCSASSYSVYWQEAGVKNQSWDLSAGSPISDVGVPVGVFTTRANAGPSSPVYLTGCGLQGCLPVMGKTFLVSSWSQGHLQQRCVRFILPLIQVQGLSLGLSSSPHACSAPQRIAKVETLI